MRSELWDNIIIKPAAQTHVKAACSLVLRVFHQFVAPGYPPEGIAEFKSYVNPSAMGRRLSEGNILFVAHERRATIGVVEVRGGNHLSLLFVAPTHHKRGIARALLETAITESCRKRPEIELFTVNAAPGAVNVYKALGFEVTAKPLTTNGIIHVPMALPIPALLRP